MVKTIACAVLMMVAAPLTAQERGGQAGREREALRRQVVDRFVQNFIQPAGLTDEQREQFGQTLRQHFGARQQVAMQRVQIFRAIEAQMRPGVAADGDSVTALVTALTELEVASASAMQEEQDAYAQFLSPIQRGLLVIHYERLQRQIQNVQRRQGQQRRGNRPGGGPPGFRPG